MRGQGSQRGRDAELRLMAFLAQDEWLCASRRHIPGPGDLLCVHATQDPRLIEVKTTSAGPFDRFGPADRLELIRTAEKAGCRPLLAWKPPRAKIWSFYSPSTWPAPKTKP